PGDRRCGGGPLRRPPGGRAQRSAPGAPVSGADGRILEVPVPDIGDFTDVPVIEIHVAAGDSVAVEDPLVTLESDKATMDVPAPSAGVVKQVGVKIGDRVSEGSVLLVMEAEVSQNGDAPVSSAPEASSPATAPAYPVSSDDGGRGYDAQVVVIGSGPGG